MKLKIITLIVLTLVLSFFISCFEHPVDSSNPHSAYATIWVGSNTTTFFDSTLIDTVGKTIKVAVTYHLGIYIDSIHVDVFSEENFKAGGEPDSTLVEYFDEEAIRDTTRYQVSFATAGDRRIVVTAYKRKGYAPVSQSARLTIVDLPVAPVNRPPQFSLQAPATHYTFVDSAKVYIPVVATDPENDPLTYSYVFDGALLPRADSLKITDNALTWQSMQGDKGVFKFVFKVSDGTSEVEKATTVVIGDTSFLSAPHFLSVAPMDVRTGEEYRYLPHIFDTQDTTFSWILLGERPQSMHFDSSTGEITWVVAPGDTTSAVILKLIVTDAGSPALSDTQSVQIVVTKVNTPPVAIARQASTKLGKPVEIFLAATDPDPNDSVLFFIITREPYHGTAMLSAIGSIIYTPDDTFKGVDSLFYVARDEATNSAEAKVIINVAVENQKPVTKGMHLTTNEDDSLPLELIASDVEGKALTYFIFNEPKHGILTGTGKNRIYVPNEDFFGADSFVFIANDGMLDGELALVTINVVAVNDTPIAFSAGLPTPQDTPLEFVLGGSDKEDTVFTYEIISLPSNGTLDTSAIPLVRYTPATGFKGNDSLVYRVRDGGALASLDARIVIAVASDNIKPVAVADKITVDEDKSVVFVLKGTDIENAALTYQITQLPTHGVVTGSGADRTYVPATNFFGQDTLTFKVHDGLLDSDPAKVVLTVNPVNDAPVVISQSLIADYNTLLAIGIIAKDVDDTVLTYKIIKAPEHGTLDMSALGRDTLFYMPENGYKGGDTIRITASDAAGLESQVATFGINIALGNLAPTAHSQAVSLDEDQTTVLPLTGTDPEGALLSFAVIKNPAHGRLEGTLPNISYRPNANYYGVDTVLFTVSDEMSTSQPAVVAITIKPVNDAPVAIAQSVATTFNTAVDINLQGKDDADNDLVFTFKIETAPKKGTIDTSAIKTGRIRYTPQNGLRDYDTIFYRAIDAGMLQSDPALIVIAVGKENNPPDAVYQNLATKEDTPINITLTGSDDQNATLTYAITGNPTLGTLSGALPNIRYTPKKDLNGSDAFTYTVNDGFLTSKPAWVNITITPVNDQPVANGQSVTTDANKAVTMTLTGYDVDNQQLTFSVTQKPKNGSVDESKLGSALLIYTPNSGFSGIDTIKFVVSDAAGLASEAVNLIVAVAQQNQQPVANGQILTTKEDAAIDITLTGSDTEGASLSYKIAQVPGSGTLSGSGNKYRYSPNKDFYGHDSLTFIVNDGQLDSKSATVQITVTPVNDAPVATGADIPTIAEDNGGSFTLKASDVDPQDVLTYEIVTGPSHGTFVKANEKITYSPNQNYCGADNFTYRVSDGIITSSNYTVSFAVDCVNDAPLATAQTVQVGNNESKTIILNGTDVEGSVLTYAIVAQPKNGTLSANSGQTIIYTPKSGFSGADEFTFTVKDAEGLASSAAKVTITVASAGNASPTITPINNQTTLVGVAKTGIQFTIGDDYTPVGSLILSKTSSEHTLVPVENIVFSGSGANRTVSVTPLASGGEGTAEITITVTDAAGLSTSKSFFLTVSAVPNTPPVVSNTTGSVNEGATVTIPLQGTDADNDALIYSYTTPSSFNGTVVISGTTALYTPGANPPASVVFSYTASDTKASSNVASVAVTINRKPTAIAQSVTFTAGAPKVITLVGADSDAGDVLTFTTLAPLHGTLSAVGAAVTYTPDASNSPDAFTFTVTDSKGLISAAATVSLTVAASSNTPPVASAVTGSVNEGTSKTIALLGSDADGDALTYQISTNPSSGEAIIVGDKVTYTPGSNPSASESFSYTANDGKAISSPASVTVTINRTPTASPQAVTFIAGTPKEITLAGTDPDGDVLIFTASVPQHGTLTSINSTTHTVTYTPDGNNTSPDAFTFTVADSKGLVSAPATVSLTVVASSNTPPVASAVTGSVNEGASKTIALLGSDADGDVLTYQISTNPSSGEAIIVGDKVTYTPGSNPSASESFSYTANDGKAISSPASVTVTINRTPTASPQAVTFIAGTPKEITLAGTDPDGDVLIFTASVPQRGTLSAVGAAVTYTPDVSNSSDAFTFTVTDSKGLISAAATVSLTVSISPNAPPTANNVSGTVVSGSSVSIPLTGIDPDGNNADLTFVLDIGSAVGGTVILSSDKKSATFTATAAGPSTGTFTFKAYDGKDNSVASATATVTITAAPNVPPTVQNATATVVSGSSVTIPLTGIDPDGNNADLTFVLDAGSAVGGTVILSSDKKSATFTATAAGLSTGTFTFKAYDGKDNSVESATATITITPANQPPIATAQNLDVVENTILTITLSATDPEGHALTYAIETSPSNGELSVIDPTTHEVTYTPTPGYSGPDTFTFLANDGELPSVPATITINVNQGSTVPPVTEISNSTPQLPATTP